MQQTAGVGILSCASLCCSRVPASNVQEFGMAFAGFTIDAFEFYEELTADNTRTFWTENKGRYERHVKTPMLELSEFLESEFGEAHLYRPYRDLRFSKDKTPYKDHQGMFVESSNGLGWYLQLSASGLMVAGGWYMSDSKQVGRYREHIADQGGPELQRYLDELTGAGFEIGGDRLKTKPRGIAADHPQVILLRFKSIYASQHWDPEPWMDTADCAGRVAEAWRSMSPWMSWLADVVGEGQPPLGSRGGQGRTDTA
jgi:uncharacterized protein (TIGR02453 family)